MNASALKKGEAIYSGKAKTLYETNRPDRLIVEFRDDATAFNGVKKSQFSHKGYLNNRFNAYFMSKLNQAGIRTHFIDTYNETMSIVSPLTMLPVECVIRNRAAGSLCKRLGIEEGRILNPPIFEFFLKDDALNDPMVSSSHITVFGWATQTQIDAMIEKTHKINQLLSPLFEKAGLVLVDFKLEFGLLGDELILGDEITPDGCRIWDIQTQQKLDKDCFRYDLGNLIDTYETLAKRMNIL